MVEDDILPAATTAAAQERAARLIDHVEVDVEVLLGEARLTIAALNELTAGNVLTIDRKLSEAADIRLNGQVIARGEIVTLDDKFAIRVTEIGE